MGRNDRRRRRRSGRSRDASSLTGVCARGVLTTFASRRGASAYDLVQRALGLQESRARVASLLTKNDCQSVIDVGAGTGAYADLVPDDAQYLAVDVDPAKLARLRRKFPRRETCVADASQLPLPSASFDCGLFIAVAHHLDDEALRKALGELRRVLTSRLVFLDPVRGHSLRSRVLWSIDRGSYPRTGAALRNILSRGFVVTEEQIYSIHHEYFLCVARPR